MSLFTPESEVKKNTKTWTPASVKVSENMSLPVVNAREEVANNPNYTNVIAGYYVGSEVIASEKYDNSSTLYKFKIKDYPTPPGCRSFGSANEEIGVWGTAKINDLMSKIELGVLVGLEYVGVFPVKKMEEDWKNPQNRPFIMQQKKNVYQEFKISADPNDRIVVTLPPAYVPVGNSIPPATPPPVQPPAPANNFQPPASLGDGVNTQQVVSSATPQPPPGAAAPSADLSTWGNSQPQTATQPSEPQQTAWPPAASNPQQEQNPFAQQIQQAHAQQQAAANQSTGTTPPNPFATNPVFGGQQ
jgi:hypothetical protein